ncbi:hypothetical protein GCM10009547_25790 [Sporichthya brevicatena]|uniref:Polysaccharide biosynthesis protein n=2 Tax=Sporichthya brevicatena TaxID=171442 RepID=A0ABN1GWH0_9ACTN
MVVVAIGAYCGLLGTNQYIVRAARAGQPYAGAGTAVRLALIAACLLAGAGTVGLLGHSGLADLDASGLVGLAGIAALAACTQVAAEHHAARRQSEGLFSRLAIERTFWTAIPPLLTATVAIWTRDWHATVVTACVSPLPILVAVRTIANRQRETVTAVVVCQRLRRDALFRSTLKTWTAAMLLLLLYRADLVLLGIFSDAGQVGIYSISLMAAECIWMYASAKSVVLFPSLVGQPYDERKMARAAARRDCLVVTAALALGACVFGYAAVKILLGVEYVDSYRAMLWLIPGVLAFVVVRLWVMEASAFGESRTPSLVLMMGLAVEGILTAFLASRYGAQGAAAACSATYVALAAVVCVIERRVDRKRSYLSGGDK